MGKSEPILRGNADRNRRMQKQAKGSVKKTHEIREFADLSLLPCNNRNRRFDILRERRSLSLCPQTCITPTPVCSTTRRASSHELQSQRRNPMSHKSTRSVAEQPLGSGGRAYL